MSAPKLTQVGWVDADGNLSRDMSDRGPIRPVYAEREPTGQVVLGGDIQAGSLRIEAGGGDILEQFERQVKAAEERAEKAEAEVQRIAKARDDVSAHRDAVLERNANLREALDKAEALMLARSKSVAAERGLITANRAVEISGKERFEAEKEYEAARRACPEAPSSEVPR